MKAFILSTDSELISLVGRACERHHPPVMAMQGLPSMSAEGGFVAPGNPDVLVFDASSYPGEGVSMLERLGLHTACWQYAPVNAVPRAASRSRFGVLATVLP